MRHLFLITFFFILHSLSYAQEYSVLGVAEPIIDILVPIEEEFLNNIPGDKGGSQRIEWESFSEILSQLQDYPSHISTGGSGANTLKGLANLRQECALLGMVGKDDMGEYFTKSFAKFGVHQLLYFSHTPTTQVLCLITPDHQRTMRVFSGAAKELTEKHLNPAYFQDSKHLHLEGYTLYNKGVAERSLQLAKEAGTTISFALGSFELVRNFKKSLLQFIPHYVDILFANEDEAYTLTGLCPELACKKLGELCPIVVITLGERGCLVNSKEGQFHSPALPANVVDTTCSGDLFASGFLHGYLEGCPLKTCAEYGNLMGKAAVEVIGAEIPEETLEYLRQLMPKK